MKFKELWAKIKPSKKVWIPTAIAVGIVAFTLFSGSEIAENIRETTHIKSPIASINYDPTVADLIEKDTDEDGIADWEESLWGTDPTLADTDSNGISDYEEIQARKAELNTGNNSDLNETDIFARELMISLMALGGEGEINEAMYDSIVSDALDSTVLKARTDFYTKDNIAQGSISKEVYLVNFNNFLRETPISDDQTIFFLDAYLETGDTAQLTAILGEAAKYEAAENYLLDIPGSPEYLELHLALINSIRNIKNDILLIAEIDDNPIVSLSGLNYYPEDKTLLGDTLSLYNKKISEL